MSNDDEIMSDDVVEGCSEANIKFYSLLSGEIYEVGRDEIKNLDQFQVPLKGSPKTSCKKCYGRGFVGFDVHRKYYRMCKCLNSQIDRELATELGLK